MRASDAAAALRVALRHLEAMGALDFIGTISPAPGVQINIGATTVARVSKTSAAERQRRYRLRLKGLDPDDPLARDASRDADRDVTRDVTGDVTHVTPNGFPHTPSQTSQDLGSEIYAGNGPEISDSTCQVGAGEPGDGDAETSRSNVTGDRSRDVTRDVTGDVTGDASSPSRVTRKSRRASNVSIPDGFDAGPSERHLEHAAAKGWPEWWVRNRHERFCLLARSKDWRYADWDRAFYTFLRGEIDYQRGPADLAHLAPGARNGGARSDAQHRLELRRGPSQPNAHTHENAEASIARLGGVVE